MFEIDDAGVLGLSATFNPDDLPTGESLVLIVQVEWKQRFILMFQCLKPQSFYRKNVIVNIGYSSWQPWAFRKSASELGLCSSWRPRLRRGDLHRGFGAKLCNLRMRNARAHLRRRWSQLRQNVRRTQWIWQVLQCGPGHWSHHLQCKETNKEGNPVDQTL